MDVASFLGGVLAGGAVIGFAGMLIGIVVGSSVARAGAAEKIWQECVVEAGKSLDAGQVYGVSFEVAKMWADDDDDGGDGDSPPGIPSVPDRAFGRN